MSLQGYTWWQHPFDGTRICMRSGLVGSLSKLALRQLKAKPGAEFGGLLWGRNLVTPSDGCLLITDAEFVDSEGPVYNRTPSDARNLVRALTQARAESGLSAVGYFRSHIREGLCLSGEDQSFIERHMRDPASVFLIIRPFDIGICMAGFFFWDGHRLQTDSSDLEIPFVPNEEPVVEDAVIRGENKIVTSTSASVSGVDQIPIKGLDSSKVETLRTPRDQFSGYLEKKAVDPPHRFKGRRFASFLVPIFLMGGLAATTLFQRSWSNLFQTSWSKFSSLSTTSRLSTQLGLEVARAPDGQLTLSWDRNAPQVAAAHSGKVTVTDGRFSRELRIDASQLRSGKLTYFPDTADVQFRLEVYLQNGHSAEDSVLMMLPRRNAVHRDMAVARGSQARARERAVPYRLPQLGTIRPTVSSIGTVVLPGIPEDLAQAADGAEKRRTATRAHRPQQAQIYKPPRPIKQVNPDVSRSWTIAVDELPDVSVEVRINAAGNVIDARTVDHPNTADPSMIAAAVTAARQWLFEPATLNNEAVAADYIIAFQFRRQADY